MYIHIPSKKIDLLFCIEGKDIYFSRAANIYFVRYFLSRVIQRVNRILFIGKIITYPSLYCSVTVQSIHSLECEPFLWADLFKRSAGTNLVVSNQQPPAVLVYCVARTDFLTIHLYLATRKETIPT